MSKEIGLKSKRGRPSTKKESPKISLEKQIEEHEGKNVIVTVSKGEKATLVKDNMLSPASKFKENKLEDFDEKTVWGTGNSLQDESRDEDEVPTPKKRTPGRPPKKKKTNKSAVKASAGRSRGRPKKNP